MVLVACALATIGCGKKAEPVAEAPEVLVVGVAQRDVPVYGEWVGTTDGFINAQIRANGRPGAPCWRWRSWGCSPA